jgi:alpha-tubulin suppressor-like RCC1 family protein
MDRYARSILSAALCALLTSALAGCADGGNGGDATAPTVSYVSPADGSTDVSVNIQVSATFSEEMDPSSITASTFSLADQGGGPVSGTVGYVGAAGAMFTPSFPLNYGTTYSATITSGVSDQAGNPMAGDYTWSFTTVELPGASAPTVVSTSPYSGATDVAPNAAISAVFSEEMDPASVNASTFFLTDQFGVSVDGVVSYSGTTAVFTPTSGLHYAEQYFAHITTGVADLAGNVMMDAYAWSFMTGDAPDTAAPTVSSNTPAHTETNVALDAVITATFSEAMDPGTITASTFTVVDQYGAQVSGTYSYSDLIATFTPSAPLEYSTLYTATVTTGVEDLAGNPLAGDYAWSFTTVSTLAGISAIGAGKNHTLAINGSDGTVWAWGSNGYGQLGDGGQSDSTAPTQVSGLTGVAVVAGGTDHSIAVKADGTVWAWGYNGSGQLGDGTTTNRYTPVQVSGIDGVTAIAAGNSHSLALKSDGTVWAWGYNFYGQLGDGTTTSSSTPVQVSGLGSVVGIAAGKYHSLALNSDGTVWAWGWNFWNQLGDGTTTTRYTPVQVSGIDGVALIAGGALHSLALKPDGTVWAWGWNNFGELGDGVGTAGSNVAIQVNGISNAAAIAAGAHHSIANKSDGTVWGWGQNASGELGNGTTTNTTTPVQASGINGAISVAAGWDHTIALMSDGTVWAWGYNNHGQVGNGTMSNSSSPVQVLTP